MSFYTMMIAKCVACMYRKSCVNTQPHIKSYLFAYIKATRRFFQLNSLRHQLAPKREEGS